MRKKAQQQAALGIGVIMIVFISVIVGVILFQVVAQQTGTATSTVTMTNYTFTSAANGSSIYLDDFRQITVTSITNGTTGDTLASGNYTVTNNQINPTTGSLSVQVATPAGAPTYDGETWALTGTAQRVTYIADSGARAVTGIIAIFFALAIAIVALVPTLRSKIIGM